MRLISQDGEIDVPYEHGSLCQGVIKGEEYLIYTISYYNYSCQKGTKLAEYSRKAKALKVMEMLREKNFWDKDVFKFPADEEVEV